MNMPKHRIEHAVKVSPCSRFKAEFIPEGKYDPEDANAAWSQTKIIVHDLAKDEVIAESSRNHHNLDIVTFFQHGAITYLLISEDWQGSYGVINCTSGQKAHWDPSAENDNPWCWWSLVGTEEVGEALVVTVQGCIEDHDASDRQFIIDEDPMKLPWRIPPMRSAGV